MANKRCWPMLYKKTSTGADQCWEIRVEGNKIITKFGQVGGKIQETEPTVCEGKNVGRANATTPEEQAVLEAEAQHTKKLKKDYVLTLDAARKGEVSDLVEGGVSPMLAHKYSEHGDKIVWPAFVQPKLDGHRCIAMTDKDGRCTLWSRTRKQINSVPHIVKALEACMDPGLVWDGELYTHSYRDKFEKLTHFIRQSEPEDGCEIVQYHVYDKAQATEYFSARYDDVRIVLCREPIDSPLKLVETLEVEDEDAMMVAFEHFLALGYEGAIVRNANGLYVNKRSYDLQKVKTFLDTDYQITGVIEGKGKMAGHGIFVCKTKDGTEFKAKMKGDHDALMKYYAHPGRYIGKQLTVKYQGLTAKSQVPRFPVALRVREDL